MTPAPPNRTMEDENEGGETGSPPSNPTGSADKTPAPASEQRRRFAERLEEAGLDTKRFIDVHYGKKTTTDHTQHEPDDPHLSGNYGVYAGGHLVDVDIDNYDAASNTTDALDAVLGLSPTLTVETPHTHAETGGHRYYRVTGDVVAAMQDVTDAANPSPSWGEVRVENQYVVGPGSQLDGCKNEWCDRCSEPDGGYYRIAADREIATITADQLVDVLCADPAYPKETNKRARREPPGDLEGEGESPSERLEAAFEKSPTGEKYRNIYDGNYAAAGYDDRSSAEYALACWLDMWVGFGDEGTVARLMDASNAEKWAERPDDSYRDSILSGVGHQDWYADENTTPTPARPLPETCVPPLIPDADVLDVGKCRAGLRAEEYDRFIRARGPVAWVHPPGVGKTTNSAVAATDRDREFAILFAIHEKAREFIVDDATPDGLYHLKGGGQPRYDCCMDAKVAASECPEHGHPSQWERMCPIYQRSKDDPLRRKFEALAALAGPTQAHFALNLHGGEKCQWLKQYDGLENRDRIVGVHEYQTQKSVRDGRDVFIDESSRLLKETTTATVEDLLDAAEFLRESVFEENADAFADFAERLIDSARSGAFDADPPAVEWESFTLKPFDAAPALTDGGTIEAPVAEPETTEYHAETLAKLRVEFNETLFRHIERGNWNVKPGVIDVLIGAASVSGLDSEACATALGGAANLRRCPWCGGPCGDDNGARRCLTSGCPWHEAHCNILPSDAEKRREVAYIEGRDNENDHSRVCIDTLPLVSDLPNSPLLLDATGTRNRIAGFYGVEPADVTIVGDEPHAAAMNITQIMDGQYHGATITNTDSLREKIQTIIDWACQEYDCPLFGGKKDVLALFDFPGERGEDYELVNYGGLRGLNRDECDAVFALGAPHWHPEPLRRNARMLAMGNDTNIRADGTEYSTARDDDGERVGEEPIYRKLLYEDENGDGLAIPTKAYSGLMGELFHEKREKELYQLVHRTRPVLRAARGEEPIDAYLLTNVPTDLPVDTVCSMDELVARAKDEPLAGIDVPAGAKELAAELRDDDADEWTRPELYERADVSERTAQRWVKQLLGAEVLEDSGPNNRGETTFMLAD